MSASLSPHTSIPVRIARLARLLFHLLRGLFILRTRFGKLDMRAQEGEIAHWSRQLLHLLGVRLESLNAPRSLPARCMLVANHISWLDIFVIQAQMPGVFVAKSEIGNWPLVGKLVRGAGTLFIDRTRRHDVQRMNENIVATLAQGRIVTVFPEGTTTDGISLGHFHASLLQPAVSGHAMLVAAALSYRDMQGARTDAATYAGETSLIESMWRIVSQREMIAHLRFGPVLPEFEHRRAAADAARQAIGELMELETVAPAA